MTFPWFSVTMLGFESGSVIRKRLRKIGRGGPQAAEEIRLMFEEKGAAAFEAGIAFMYGAPLRTIVARYRARVAGNEARLSASENETSHVKSVFSAVRAMTKSAKARFRHS